MADLDVSPRRAVLRPFFAIELQPVPRNDWHVVRIDYKPAQVITTVVSEWDVLVAEYSHLLNAVRSHDQAGVRLYKD